ncbi:hypothetical protein NCCP2145_07830 [Pseudarthrobacter sp. NCCP-2145]|nr:hypothetical protein NCCP2145_07830 [Pseudarthrobacter sp. NCCP-2145]
MANCRISDGVSSAIQGSGSEGTLWNIRSADIGASLHLSGAACVGASAASKHCAMGNITGGKTGLSSPGVD